jgi:hypothetical protein
MCSAAGANFAFGDVESRGGGEEPPTVCFLFLLAAAPAGDFRRLSKPLNDCPTIVRSVPEKIVHIILIT